MWYGIGGWWQAGWQAVPSQHQTPGGEHTNSTFTFLCLIFLSDLCFYHIIQLGLSCTRLDFLQDCISYPLYTLNRGANVISSKVHFFTSDLLWDIFNVQELIFHHFIYFLSKNDRYPFFIQFLSQNRSKKYKKS